MVVRLKMEEIKREVVEEGDEKGKRVEDGEESSEKGGNFLVRGEEREEEERERREKDMNAIWLVYQTSGEDCWGRRKMMTECVWFGLDLGGWSQILQLNSAFPPPNCHTLFFSLSLSPPLCL